MPRQFVISRHRSLLSHQCRRYLWRYLFYHFWNKKGISSMQKVLFFPCFLSRPQCSGRRGRKFKSCRPEIREPLSAVDSGSFLLSAQALTANVGCDSVCSGFRQSMPVMPAIANGCTRLREFGATVGATGNGRRLSVPVACIDVRSDVDFPSSGNPGKAFIAP